MRIIRPEQRVLTIGNPGLRIEGALASAVGEWWEVPGKTCVAAWQPKGAASFAASLVNLAQPGTYDAVSGATDPTWATGSGWTFNGSQHMATGLTPNQDGSWSVIIQYTDLVTSGYNSCGIFAYQSGAAREFGVGGYWGGNQVTYGTGSKKATKGPQLLAGNLCAAGAVGYRNGTFDVALGDAATGTIQAIRLGGEAVSALRARVVMVAAAIYSSTLAAGEVATLSAAMAAL